MKATCYLVLIIGFFIFYQQNPFYAVIIIGIVIGGYILIKSRRSQSGGTGFLGFMKGNPQQDTRNYDDLITLMMLQQLIGTNNNQKVKEVDSSHKEDIDQIKKEVLEILDE